MNSGVNSFISTGAMFSMTAFSPPRAGSDDHGPCCPARDQPARDEPLRLHFDGAEIMNVKRIRTNPPSAMST